LAAIRQVMALTVSGRSPTIAADVSSAAWP
jgi:hypothetical protein